MYHTHFHGTHYDIGFRYGSALRKNGKFILDNVPFPIEEEQLTFAAACRPLYETHFPEILQEIRGLSDGQKCPSEKLEAMLFCMYCMVPSCRCSHFAVRNGQNVIFGRNSDFLTCIEHLYLNCIYHFSGSSYSFTGNTTAFVEMEDGINNHGLAIGLTMVQTHVLRPGLNAGMILRLILEKCTNVQEALTLLEKIPTASGHTFVLADRTGTIALAECCPGQTEILCPQESDAFVCASNLFHTEPMKKYNVASDNWQAEERYQTLLKTLRGGLPTFNLSDGQKLLSGKNGFLCQYDRKTGKDTVWSVLYDVKNDRLYRTEGNPSRKKYREDRRFSRRFIPLS